MDTSQLIDKIADLEKQLKHFEDENAALKSRIKELEGTLQTLADAAAAKKPKFPLNYSSQRNEPKKTDASSAAKNTKINLSVTPPKTAGRKPKCDKHIKSNLLIEIFPENVKHSRCVLKREQFVWRLIDNKAKYIHYKIFDLPDSTSPPTVPGVRNERCEYGVEFLVLIAHHVYWLGLSMDKTCRLIHFYTGITISKSQADTLLYQLSNDWQREYKEIAQRIAIASVLYIDETAWKVGKKACYTWFFGTLSDVYYRCGVSRCKTELTDVITEDFNGIGVTDNYGAYLNTFSQHQLCWAHLLRKAIELMLRNPTNKSYQDFYLQLLYTYRLAKVYQQDESLVDSRAEKVIELQSDIKKLCERFGEVIITKEFAEKNDLDKSSITPEPEATMIRLQNELVSSLESLFVFVLHPEVDGTNNRSEQALREEAQTRKAGRTSKTPEGASRRGTIISVFGTLKKRLEEFTLSNILTVVFESYKKGISLFAIAKPPDFACVK